MEPVRAPGVMRILLVAMVVGVAVLAVNAIVDLGDALLNDFVRGSLYVAVLTAAGAACIVRATLGEREGVAWLLFGAGILSWAAGQAYWAAVLLNDPSPPFPSPADVGHLWLYPLLYLGMMALLSARIRDFRRSFWLDGIIGALAIAAIGAAFVFDPLIGATDGNPVSIGFGIAFPLADVLLFALVLAITALAGWRHGRTWEMVLAGLVVLAIADAVYSSQLASEDFVPSDFNQALWVIAAMLMAAAAWWPDRGAATQSLEGWRSLLVPSVAAMAAVSLIALYAFESVNAVALSLAVATLIAAVVRMAISSSESERLYEQVRRDNLTGLGNRGKLLVDIRGEISIIDPGESRLFALFDLDGFKLYNDTFGHPAGDALLVRLARKLEASVGERGEAYRLGGDEFCVLARADGVAPEEIVSAARQALRESGEGFDVTSSCGVVTIPEEAESPATALQLADERMYVDKDARQISASRQAKDVLVQTVRERRPALGSHVEVVSRLTRAVGERLGLGPTDLQRLTRAAELHDIGKIAIPDAILESSEPLGPEELEFVRQHTVLGERIIRAAPALVPLARLVRSCHERFDGSGYPDGLRGDQIPLGSRIIGACDAYHAMISERPYSPALTPGEARAELQRCAGTQFDPVVVDVLCEELERDTQLAPAAATPGVPGLASGTG